MADKLNVTFTKEELFGRLIYKADEPLDVGVSTDTYTTVALPVPKEVYPSLIYLNNDTNDAAGVGATNLVRIQGSIDGTNWVTWKHAAYVRVGNGTAAVINTSETDGHYPYCRVWISLGTAVTSGAKVYPHILIKP